MLVRLDLSTGDRWTTLIAGFDILHGPVTSAILSEAGHASTSERLEERVVQVTQFVARSIIRDWRGVADEATGEPIPVTPDAINQVMDVWPIFRAFNDKVIDGRIRVDREKKDLPPLPNGTSGAGQATAPTATDPAPTARVN